MTRKKPPDSREIFNLWMCCNTVFDSAGAEAHLIEVHGVTTPVRGKMRFIKTLDAEQWFQTNYEWTIGDLVIIQKVRLRRT